MSSDQKQTPTRGVAITLDKERFLRFPLGALKKLQEQKGTSLAQLLLLGLQKDDPALTLEQLEDLIDLENLHTLFGPVKKATGGLVDLSKIFPADEKGPGAAPDPQSPPQGASAR
jgi:hypothetical protein